MTTGPHVSNFDQSVDEGVEELLAQGGWVPHAAMDHWGKVRRDEDGVYREEVWRYNVPVETMEAPTLSALMVVVNEKYGYD